MHFKIEVVEAVHIDSVDWEEEIQHTLHTMRKLKLSRFDVVHGIFHKAEEILSPNGLETLISIAFISSEMTLTKELINPFVEDHHLDINNFNMLYEVDQSHAREHFRRLDDEQFIRHVFDMVQTLSDCCKETALTDIKINAPFSHTIQ